MVTVLERDAELGRLRMLRDAARGGRGCIAFVAGEAGIGKSTLVDAFAGDVAAEHACCVWSMRRVDNAARVSVHCSTSRPTSVFPDTTTVTRCSSEMVADIRGHGLTVLVVEDAHWADDASIDLLAMLGRRVVDLPLLLIVTYREDVVTGDHPLRLVIGDLITASSTVWFGLAPLTRDAVESLAARSGVPGDELFDRTGGNPFFVTEALAAPADEIPTSIRLAVLARAGRLEPAERSVLDAVSVVPGRAEGWLVSALCEQADRVRRCLRCRRSLDDGSPDVRLPPRAGQVGDRSRPDRRRAACVASTRG